MDRNSMDHSCHGAVLRKIPEHKITGAIYHCVIGYLFCAECYANLIPPYPGPHEDPQLLRARHELETHASV